MNEPTIKIPPGATLSPRLIDSACTLIIDMIQEDEAAQREQPIEDDQRQESTTP